MTIMNVDTTKTVTSPSEEAQERVFDYKGTSYQAPPELWDFDQNCLNAAAAAKRAIDLRRQLGAKSQAEGEEVPDAYHLTIPEGYKDKVTISDEDPFVQKAKEWAKQTGLSQRQFDQISSVYLTHYAGETQASEEYRQEQEHLLSEAFGDKLGEKKDQIAQWAVGISGGKPEFLTALEHLTCSASGVLFLEHLRQSIGERAVPSFKEGGQEQGPTKQDLHLLQGSAAYRDPLHADHHKVRQQVTEGYQRLFEK